MNRRGAGRQRLTTRDVVVVAAVALGLACAMGVWGLGASAAVFVCAACTAAVICGVITERVTAGVRNGIAIGLCLAAAAGLVAALGWLGALILLALAATSPVVLSRLGSRWRAESPPGQPIDIPLSPTMDIEEPARTQVVEPYPADVRELDDAQLCLAWRRSYVRLETERGAAARLAIVEQRQCYLDELQRRHGTAFQAWLESGARASGNPLPYLKHRDAPGTGDRVSDGKEPETPG